MKKETTRAVCAEDESLRQRETMCVPAPPHSLFRTPWTSEESDWRFQERIWLNCSFQNHFKGWWWGTPKGYKVSFRALLIYFRPKNKYSNWQGEAIQSFWLSDKRCAKTTSRGGGKKFLISSAPACPWSKSLRSLRLECVFWQLDPEKSPRTWGLGRTIGLRAGCWRPLCGGRRQAQTEARTTSLPPGV